MGNAYTSQCKLPESEISTYTKQTVFNSDEIRALWVHFKTINSSHEFINRKYSCPEYLFSKLTGFSVDNFKQRCYLKTLLYWIASFALLMLTMMTKFRFPNIFPAYQQYQIKRHRKTNSNVSVYILILLPLTNDLLVVSFQIYDFDGDNYISVSDLTAVVAATLREHKIFILRSDIDQIVQSTMIEASPKHANMISFDELVTKTPPLSSTSRSFSVDTRSWLHISL